MAQTLLINKALMCGLDILNHTIPTGAAGPHSVHVELTEVPPTGLSVVINQNASPIFTAPTISATQIAQQFKFGFLAADADVISVVIASSTAIDSVANNVKATVTIQQGF